MIIKTCKSWGLYMKQIQVIHSGEYGKTEGEKDRERFGERGRDAQQWESTAWVDFDCCSKSTTPANAQHLRISRGCQSIRTTEGLDVNQTFGWHSTFLNYFWLINIRSNNTRSATIERRYIFQNDREHRPIQSWALICETLLSRNIKPGVIFQLRQVPTSKTIFFFVADNSEAVTTTLYFLWNLRLGTIS